MTFIEWSDDMERRFDTMPKWYFNHEECERHYLAYVTYSAKIAANKKWDKVT